MTRNSFAAGVIVGILVGVATVAIVAGGVAVKRWHPSDYIGRPVCVTVLQRPVT